jgi:hypothetical protein
MTGGAETVANAPIGIPEGTNRGEKEGGKRVEERGKRGGGRRGRGREKRQERGG